MIDAKTARTTADEANSSSVEEVLAMIKEACEAGKYELKDIILRNKFAKVISDELSELGFKVTATSMSLGDRTTTLRIRW